MSQKKNGGAHLSRRSWMVLTASALGGCGGGGSAGMAGLPGTGGTGQPALLYVQGPISGFGSVRVNGIKFDDAAASVQFDGLPAASSDLRLGMVASVQGQRGAVATLGTASSIEVWSIAQGLVAAAQGGQFTVAGMTVQTDSATVFEGLAGAAALSPGLRVTVWGLQAAADGSRWIATRVASPAASAVVSTGFVSLQGAQRFLNRLPLAGPATAGLADGQLVRVQGTPIALGTSLQVERVRLLGPDIGPAPQGEVEIEGLVTAILSASRFMLGPVEVDASSASVRPALAAITVGARLEVEGVWQARLLKATSVELQNAQTLQQVEIEADIDQFTSLADFVVRGQRCDASGAGLSSATVAALKVGVRVSLHGIKDGAVLRVTELEIEAGTESQTESRRSENGESARD